MGEDALTMTNFFASWEFFEPAVMTAVVVGAALGLIGVYIVLRRLVFLSAALGQAASLGVVLVLWLFADKGGELFAQAAMDVGVFLDPAAKGAEIGPLIGAIVVACIATLIVGRKAGGAYRDGLLGAIFLVGAAGTLLVATQIPNELHDIEALLKGEGVAVDPDDFALVAKLCGVVILAHVFAWRGFTAVSFDSLGAEVRRVPVRFFELLLAVSIAVGISAGIRVLGPLPVFALSVVPALAATRLGRNIPESLAIGVVLAIIAGVYGYIFAYLMGFGVGASQTGMAVVLALLVECALRLPNVGSPRLFRLAKSTAAPWVPRVARVLGLGLLVSAVIVGLRPIRQGMGLGDASIELVLGVVGLLIALPGVWLAWQSHERGVVTPGMLAGVLGIVLVAFCWQDAEGWVELVRPLILATVLAGLAACMREVAHRLDLEKASAAR